MGKNLRQQARGKGGPTYRAPSFRYEGEVRLRPLDNGATMQGTITEFIKCQGHSAPLARVRYNDGNEGLIIAPEGVYVGQLISSGPEAPIEKGNQLPLKNIPDGAFVFNIEGNPGDGGKFCRTGGSSARLLTKTEQGGLIMLPSKKEKIFSLDSRAQIGVISGGGRLEKPRLKAGVNYFRYKMTNKKYPIMAGSAQNAVDHPFGNKRTSRKSKARPAPHNAPPGRNVGMIRPRRTGRAKRG